MEAQTINKILIELGEIKQELNFIKNHMVDADTLLTPDEEARLSVSLKEYKEGKTIPLSKLKKAVGV